MLTLVICDSRERPTCATEFVQKGYLCEIGRCRGARFLSICMSLGLPSPRYFRFVATKYLRCLGVVHLARALGKKVHSWSVILANSKMTVMSFISWSWHTWKIKSDISERRRELRIALSRYVVNNIFPPQLCIERKSPRVVKPQVCSAFVNAECFFCAVASNPLGKNLNLNLRSRLAASVEEALVSFLHCNFLAPTCHWYSASWELIAHLFR